MDREEIFALEERVIQACPPECSVEIVPTKQKNDVHLIVIQLHAEDVASETGFSSSIHQHSADFQKILERNPTLKTVYFWEEQKIHKFHYEHILPLLNDAEHFRVLYCCGSRFVLYVHNPLSFEHYFNVIDFIGMNDDKHYKYIGSCRNNDILIGYLMRTFEPF